MTRTVVIGLLAALLIRCAAAVPTSDRFAASPTSVAAAETKPEEVYVFATNLELPAGVTDNTRAKEITLRLLRDMELIR